ncbi:MAG: potassium-transporting ATPase subunit KdpA [Dehalococcoidales bacterium]
MSLFDVLQIILYLVILVLLAKPLGAFMARVINGERNILSPVMAPVERFTYRMLGTKSDEEMNWKQYAIAVVLFALLGVVTLYIIERLQGVLPFNPQHLPGVPSALAFNTSISFNTNTNWQNYGGETTMTYFTQMVGLTVHNFLSAAAGIAVLMAVIRGFTRHSVQTLGNFWVDMTRSVLYILIPLSLILAVVLMSQGVVQTLSKYKTAEMLQSTQDVSGQTISQQIIAVGPVASQEAIELLGTNGGGFFNTNAAHPFQNPTPLTNFLLVLAILLIPAALCYTFGKMVGDTRQGWAILSAIMIIFVVMLTVCVWSEQVGNPALTSLNVNQAATTTQSGGNMEGKEEQIGAANSALWSTATTAASNGSVNSMLDSYTPLGGLVPMWLIQLGEVIFGGVGSGLYGMLAFVIIAVFIAGLMIGRTPEYLGKKIESYEMKMAAIMVLIPVLFSLLGTAVAVISASGQSAVSNPGIHGFSEILYAFSSTSNNNGSAFAGYGSNVFINVIEGICMFIGRFWLQIPILAVAGSLVKKKKVPVTSGTLPTYTPLFIFWLIAVVIIVGALSFFPALSLGPIGEFLKLR